MQSIAVPGVHFLHRLHPLTKLVGAVLVIMVAYVVPWLLAPLFLFSLLLVLAWGGGVAGRFLRATLRVLLPLTVSLFVIQGVLFPPPGSSSLVFGPLVLPREGLLFAFVVSSRLLTFTGAFLLIMQTTHPADLVFALTERGLPQSIGYILLVSLQIVPDMRARATAIVEAQRSRGLETQGGMRRLRALVPLIGPLVVGALLDVEERAMALELRAYTVVGPKTSLRELVDTPGQRVARWVMLLLVLVGVIGRFVFAFVS